eukprot:PhF_6_TR32908/c0_g1_i1/m.48383
MSFREFQQDKLRHQTPIKTKPISAERLQQLQNQVVAETQPPYQKMYSHLEMTLRKELHTYVPKQSSVTAVDPKVPQQLPPGQVHSSQIEYEKLKKFHHTDVRNKAAPVEPNHVGEFGQWRRKSGCSHSSWADFERQKQNHTTEIHCRNRCVTPGGNKRPGSWELVGRYGHTTDVHTSQKALERAILHHATPLNHYSP